MYALLKLKSHQGKNGVLHLRQEEPIQKYLSNSVDFVDPKTEDMYFIVKGEPNDVFTQCKNYFRPEPKETGPFRYRLTDYSEVLQLFNTSQEMKNLYCGLSEMQQVRQFTSVSWDGLFREKLSLFFASTTFPLLDNDAEYSATWRNFEFLLRKMGKTCDDYLSSSLMDACVQTLYDFHAFQILFWLSHSDVFSFPSSLDLDGV